MSKNTEVTDEIISMIYQFSEATGGATKEIITSYAQWNFYNSISWLIFGVAITGLSIMLCFKKYDEAWDGIQILFGVMALMFSIFVFANIADIISPEKYAIQKIITQIKK